MVSVASVGHMFESTLLHTQVHKLLLLSLLVACVVCPPVEKRPAGKEQEASQDETEERLGLEYERYMREVVKLLESDESFRKQLESVNASEIRSGKIAEQLKFVDRGIRSRLDELKRAEMERLRNIFRMKGQLDKKRNRGGSGRRGHTDDLELLGHVDPSSHSFEVEDLVKLIKKTSADLERIDEERKAEFKRYEMRKEHERREEMDGMGEEERRRAEKEHQEMEQKHKDHPKINHPGNEEQLKEVWEEADGLDKDAFDPKTFFHLHDTNGDGMLDIEELEALFQLELDKVYNSSAEEDDMAERYEEMNRMREHVMKEFDTNKDMMVSLEEFVVATKREEFKEQEDWQTLDNQTLYSDEEMRRFEEDMAQRMELTERPPVVVTSAAASHVQQDQALHFEPQQHEQQPPQQHEQQPPQQQQQPPQQQHEQQQQPPQQHEQQQQPPQQQQHEPPQQQQQQRSEPVST